jgi:anti-sigma factor RsiW
MIVDDTVLLAYVEGTLSADDVQGVEQACRSEPEIAERIARLEGSRLDFTGAFTRQALPPLPKSISDAVEQMSASARRFEDVEGPNDIGNRQRIEIASDVAVGRMGLDVGKRRRRLKRWWAAWAKPMGGFAAGALCCGLILYIVGGQGRGDALNALPVSPDLHFKPVDVASTSVPVARWIKAAAGYQQLFGRETEVDSVVDAASLTKTVDAIHNEDKMALQVPDLAALGLTLKDIKRLRYHGETLVQIVYLPATGAPVALCVMKEATPRKPGVPAQTRLTVEDMDVVTWRQSDLRYALIAVPGSTDLGALAKKVARST